MPRTPAVASALLLLTLTGCAGTGEPSGGTPAPPVSEGASAGAGDATSAGSAGEGPTPGAQSADGEAARQSASVGTPVRLSMPSIDFDRSLTAMGVNAQGQISPPAGVTQWYDKSVVPGERGISVIAGHVTYDGPDVFADLDRLDKGDVVTVDYSGGKSKRFRVYAEQAVGKKALQTDARVWGSSDTPVLALITCDAASRVVGRHHVSNYVVWAAPVKGSS